jgi:hypothetical protein
MTLRSAFRPDNEEFERGLELFNRGHYFEAHEVLEDVWRSVARDLPFRRHLQGMVQLAVAFHHQSRGNYVGARSVLERALRNLHGSDVFFGELDMERLRADLEPWRSYLLQCAGASLPSVAPALPIVRRKIRGRSGAEIRQPKSTHNH